MVGFRSSLLLIQVASGLLLIGLSVPLIRRRIPPNHWYGFRVRRTLGDPTAWYEANAYAGRSLLAAGIAIVAGSLALDRAPGLDGPTFAVACAMLSLSCVASGVILSFRHLGRIAKPADR